MRGKRVLDPWIRDAAGNGIRKKSQLDLEVERKQVKAANAALDSNASEEVALNKELNRLADKAEDFEMLLSGGEANDIAEFLYTGGDASDRAVMRFADDYAKEKSFEDLIERAVRSELGSYRSAAALKEQAVNSRRERHRKRARRPRFTSIKPP